MEISSLPQGTHLSPLSSSGATAQDARAQLEHSAQNAPKEAGQNPSVSESAKSGRSGAEQGDSKPSAADQASQKKAGAELTEQDLKLVDQLENRDREVRQHERAHASVGGQYTGAPEYDYTRGPDGRMYATSGEVSVDTSPVNQDPAATVEKMRTVIAAALAPAEPSTTDRQVAAKAQALMTEALAELSLQAEQEEQDAQTEDGDFVESSGSVESASGAESSAQSAGSSDSSSTGDEQNSGAAEGEVRDRSGLAPGSDDKDAATQQLEMERRLVETGVFSRVFPHGSLISQDA